MEETQAVHKQETREQVAARKAVVRSLIGPSRECNTQPSPAQHAARTTLRNEIATVIRTDLGANTAVNGGKDLPSTRQRSWIALAQVAMEQSDSAAT